MLQVKLTAYHFPSIIAFCSVYALAFQIAGVVLKLSYVCRECPSWSAKLREPIMQKSGLRIIRVGGLWPIKGRTEMVLISETFEHRPPWEGASKNEPWLKVKECSEAPSDWLLEPLTQVSPFVLFFLNLSHSLCFPHLCYPKYPYCLTPRCRTHGLIYDWGEARVFKIRVILFYFII